MSQNNSNLNNLNLLPENNYLVTRAVTTSSIPEQKVHSDLDLLEKSERKTAYRTNIAKDIRDPQIYIAMSALRLANPFKGY